MRCWMGRNEDRLGPLPLEAHMENTVKVFRAARAQALDLGVKIALENHADLPRRARPAPSSKNRAKIS